MNVNAKILGLMAALAAGSAFAQTVGPVRTGNATNAGTSISNTATATFDDPGTPGTSKTETSNTVTTTVAAKHGFNITYTSGADSDTTDTVAGAAVSQTDVVPGQWVAFEYVAVNNGNDTQTITLSTQVDGVDAGTVKYYLGTATVNPTTGVVTGTELPKVGGNYQIQNLKPSGDDPATGPVENNTGIQTFTMVYQVPTNLARGASAGASPVGTALVWDGSANVSATEQKDPEPATPTYDDLWWQFNRVTATIPNVTTTPPPAPNPDPNGPGTPANPGTVVVPPTDPGGVGTGNPGSGTPNDPVDPADSPTDPNVPTKTGYKDGTTVIAIGSDRQEAYPVGGVTSVTFTNVVTNGGTLSDTVTLIPPTGLPTGVSVSFPGTDADPAAPGFQVVVPAGATVAYQVKVDFPSTPNSATPLAPIDVTIGVDSGNDNDTAADGTTRDIVHPPAFRFGDDNNQNGVAFGTDPGTVETQSVVPGTNTTPNITSNTSDNVAVFPMNLENTGDYNDSYTLSATTSLTGATVRYFDASGNELPKDASGNYISPVVGKGTEITVYAVMVVPNTALSGDYTLNQTATANYSGISISDTNDVIRVGVIGGLALAKFVEGGTGGATFNGVTAPTGYGIGAGPSVAPGGTLRYVIIGKNTYNTTVNSVVLSDDLRANVTYVGATCAVYSASDTVVGGKTCTASNAGGTVTSTAVNLASGEYVRVDLSVTIK